MAYNIELDWEKEQIVARKLLQTKELLEIQIKAFIDQLNKIEG